MATSGSYDWTATRLQICNRALRIVGISSPTSTQLSDSVEALNAMVKNWQNDGIKLWTIQGTDKSLAALSGAKSYSESAEVLRLGGLAYIKDASNNEYPVSIISKREYDLIPDKGTTGRITHMALDLQTSPVVYIYPALGSSYTTDTLHYSRVIKIQDFDADANNPDFPVAWIDVLVFNLAANMAYEHQIAPDDIAILERKAKDLLVRATLNNNDNTPCDECAPSYPVDR